MLEIKGRISTLTLLKPGAADLRAAAEELEQKLQQAPGFFSHSPAVVDISAISSLEGLDIFLTAARNGNLIPFAYTGRRAGEDEISQLCGLSWLPEIKLGGGVRNGGRKKSGDTLLTENGQLPDAEETEQPDSPVAQNPETEDNNETSPETATDNSVATEGQPAPDTAEHSPADPEDEEHPELQGAMLVTSPVRSGQQVYAKGRDLVVLSSVSQGAEVLADGHIHVYGPLRGRAMAGVLGDESAMVFCHRLDAELVAIAGTYSVNEDLGEEYRNKAVRISLQDDRLVVQSL